MFERPQLVYMALLERGSPGAISDIEQLQDLLCANNFEAIIDLRRQHNINQSSEFDDQSLRLLSNDLDIQYHWAGRQFANHYAATEEGPDRELHASLRGYAEYMRSEKFAMAIKQLFDVLQHNRCLLINDFVEEGATHQVKPGISGLIADYLTLHGHQVIHLNQENIKHEHRLSAAVRRESLELVYDRKV